MYQQQDSWRAPGGEPAPDYFPPDSAELPTPFAQDAGPSSSRTTTSNDQAQPDPWAEYLSAPTNKWGHSSWEWRGDGWDSWNWRSENTRAYNQPRGGNAWTRHASWDGTWGSASTGSGGDGGMDQNEAKQDDGSAPAGGKGTTAAGRTSLTSPATTTTSAPTPATMPTSRGEGGEEAIRGAGPSERMVVPSFSGGSGDDGEELGTTARSYLRQVAAWQKMTRLSPCRQGLVLYQNLSGKAWIEAERLDLELLGSSNGVSHLVEWIKERYLDVQVTQVGRALSDFFRKLRKKPGQSIRDYVGEFDRAQARLEECGCSLPNIAQAWVFIDRMNLDEPSELNLLASVGNLYDLRKLQQAAIIQDRALRKPWESSSGAKPWARRQNQSAHMADALDTEEIHQDEPDLHDGANDPIPEHLAEELFTTFMSHETAKQKYRDNQKNRGTDPQALKDIAAERLKQMKARSFCAGCKRRGHWHRDEACPLNQAKKNREDNGAGDDNRAPLKSTYMTCNVVHVAWNMDKKDLSAGFDAITDTACSKSVAGNDWMEEYTTRLEDIGVKPQLLTNDEYFRFGASRVFHSTMACVLTFRLGKAVIEVKIAIVQGELPLLLSRPVLARLGMVMDVATNRADFRKVDAYDVPLKATAAFWAAEEIKIHTKTVIPLFGSEGLLLLGAPCLCQRTFSQFVMATPQTAPAKQLAISAMKKPELLEELKRHGVPVHPKWTVPELRSVLGEERAKKQGTTPQKGLSSMTLDELRTTAEELRIDYPKTANKGALMRMIRDTTQDVSERLMTFGRYKGYLYREVPPGYRRWAREEVARNTNASNDLVMFAAWAERELHSQTPAAYHDPEAAAMIPYNPEDESAWDLVTDPEKGSSSTSTMSTRTNAVGLPLRGGYAAVGPPARPNLTTQKAKSVPKAVMPPPAYSRRREAPEPDQIAMDLEQKQIDDQVVEEIEALETSDMVYDGYDCGGDAYDVYYEDFLSVDQVELWSAQGIPDTNKDLPVEIAATRALYDKDFTYDTMLKVSDLLPDSAVIQLRMGATGRPNGKSNKSLVGGAWAHGNKAGATNNLGQYPQLFKYINAWGHHHGIKGWSSVMLTKNVAHLVHADNHNLPGYPNHTTSYGQFVGGELWVALENYEESLDYKVVWKQDRNGKDHPGELINTREQIVEFNPKKLHATQAWSGTRWCLTFFASRGVTMLARRERDLLQQLGFGLPDRRRTPPLLQEDNKTRTTSRPPKRSARKLIQKTAKRLSALATWTILAAMNYTAAHVPLPGRTEPVALCEVGGTNKTEELSTMDEFFATEPINVDFLVGIGGRKRAVEVIRELRPATLWIHGGNIADTGDTIVELVEEQKKAFGRIVIEAPSDHAFWVTPLAAIFYDDPTATVFEEENNKTIEINGTSAAWKQAVDTGGNPSLQVYMASNEERQQGADQRDDVHLGAAGISFPGEPRVKPEVSSALKRLHANLGHPSQADLTRHLRLAGAGPEVIQASKRLQCETCQRASKGGIARPATLPTLLSFNQVVGVDIFSVTDAFDERIEMMSIYDHGTSYHIAGPLQGHSTEAMEQTFCELWSRTFGAPGTIALDLESGLQAGLARYSSWHGCHLRPIAGQAHWQLGATERHGGVWKAIWRRLCDDLSVGEDDISLAVAAVNQAKNELRRTSGYSPSQAVFGRDPYVPGELLDEKDGEQQEQLINQDLQRGREHAIRMAARAAYFRVQGDQKLRRALLQRSRVTGEELHPGDLVFFLRKPKNSKDWSWKGPGTVVGTEHKNLWISFGGRCHLVAPEHVRRATNEETGNAFILKTNRDDLQRLVEYDPDDVDMFEDEDNAGPVQHEGGPLPPVPEDDWDISSLMSYAEDIELPEGNDERTFGTYERPDPPDLLPAGPVPKRMRKKGPQQVNMMRQATTQRGKEKQLERELPWHCIPESQHAAFKEAELKQWNEHLQHGAMEPVDVETSAEILRSRPERVLPSRFAYRDKHWAKRKQDNSLPWKCKARLVIGGHRDPDLDKGLATSAPTVSRQGVLLLCQILASRRKLGWGASAGDITCAFLNGNRLERELYIRQPRAGLGDLDPRQLVRLTKGVFGLVDSPNAWWGKLYQSILNMKVELEDGREGFFDQCPLDPCIFQFKVVGTDGQPGVPECYVAVHVDDLLMVGDKGLNSQLKAAFSKTFPVEDWEDDAFEYTGSFFEVNDKGVFIRQENYVDTRLFEVFVNPAEHDETIATAEQKADNRSLIGALSWIAGQTRPDLQTGVSMAQQLQREPTAGDVRFTNLLSKRAKQYKECGVHLTPVNLDTCVLLAYHDAAWANAPQDPDDPYYELTPEENEIGTLKDGPFAYKDRKAKRGNSRVASQLGGVYLLADEGILHGGESPVSLIDWRSWACDRVCRSTFAAESMSCAGGIENAQYLQSFLATLLQGCLVRPKQSALKVRYLSDCRSLFDHLRREGLPRVPSDRRLAIDLAAIRCDLKLGGVLEVSERTQTHLMRPPPPRHKSFSYVAEMVPWRAAV
ncbi:RE2 [Symbiodinium sp. KB8]|nr:RE2 [Symbiodinium sp. KB8]